MPPLVVHPRPSSAPAPHSAGHNSRTLPLEQCNKFIKERVRKAKNGTLADIIQELKEMVGLWMSPCKNREAGYSRVSPAPRVSSFFPTSPDAWMLTAEGSFRA